MKIINPKTGKPVPMGTLGEICTRGFHVMMGYDNAPDKTKEALDEEGWLHTGDIGCIDEQGNYHYAYRMKEIVVRGGENISLCEIEEAIAEYPGVDATKAFGVPSADLGEEVIATICVQKITALAKVNYVNFYKSDWLIQNPKELHFFTEFPHTLAEKLMCKR